MGAYSPAVVVMGTVYVSGQLGIVPTTGNLASDDVREQTIQMMTNLIAVLRAAGSDGQNVVKCTLFLCNIEDLAAVNEIYAKFFSANLPARSAVQVAALPKNALVEIDAIALRHSG